jgi:hypothetical protein
VDARALVRTDVVNVAGLRGPDLHRAVALELRAVLTPENNRRAPAPVTSEIAPAAGVASPVVVPATAPEPRRAPALALAAGVGYAASWTPGADAASTRAALALRATAALGRKERVELLAGVDLPLAVEGTVAAGSISLRDVPLRMGGRLRWRAARFVMGVGAFGAVHLLFASARSSAGAHDNSRTAAGGGGVEALVRGPLVGPLSWEIRGFAEGMAPRTRFLVGGTPAIETGRYAMGGGLGLTFPTR